jgi:hypothetical protein
MELPILKDFATRVASYNTVLDHIMQCYPVVIYLGEWANRLLQAHWHDRGNERPYGSQNKGALLIYLIK